MERLRYFDRYLGEREIGRKAIRMIDYETKGKAWPGQLRRWKTHLLTKPRATHDILAELTASERLQQTP